MIRVAFRDSNVFRFPVAGRMTPRIRGGGKRPFTPNVRDIFSFSCGRGTLIRVVAEEDALRCSMIYSNRNRFETSGETVCRDATVLGDAHEIARQPGYNYQTARRATDEKKGKAVCPDGRSPDFACESAQSVGDFSKATKKKAPGRRRSRKRA